MRLTVALRARIVRRIATLAESRSQEGGYITILVAMLLASGTLMACLAISVDTSRWYDEIGRVQKAADAAALAGVPFLPFDMANATIRAKEVAKRNGYDDASERVVVTVEKGELSSQLKVTISSRIDNQFGTVVGVDNTTITRMATADYKGPAPMGSPCNTFGNEPDAGAGASSPTPTDTALGTELPECKRLVDFWAGIQGVRSAKSNGDRYMNSYCNTSTTASPRVPHPVYLCTGDVNTEYDPSAASNAPPGKRGYFWVVRVQPNAINQPITLQLYDAAYVNSGDFNCGSLPASSGLDNNMNPYVTTDGKQRYSSNLAKAPPLPGQGAPFCNGDAVPAHAEGTAAPTTTFVLRAQTDTQDPMQAPAMTSDGCVKQYKGVTTVPNYNRLKSTSGSYNQQLAQLFHNWTNFCTFTPDRAGDYYLQVRTNVSFVDGTAIPNNGSNPSLISNGNSTAYAPSGTTNAGNGTNNFAVRAITSPGLEDEVSVSGYDRMPIFANKEGAESEFHLIRVLPGAAGQYISFSFFDAADADGTEPRWIQVKPPSDATGGITTTPFPSPGCQSYFGASGSTKTTLTNCQAPVDDDTNNGKLETIEIPIPGDYDCDTSTIAGCWYRVVVHYGALTGVHDFTTWDATIIGDPVRLIE